MGMGSDFPPGKSGQTRAGLASKQARAEDGGAGGLHYPGSQQQLLWSERASPAGGEEMPIPASCPLRLARSPRASAGNDRGPQRLPSQARLCGRPGREGGHCRPLLQFPQPSPAPGGPWELTKLPPTCSCPASPSPTLGTGPPGPGLLKWQVQSGNEVMPKLGVECTWAKAGWARHADRWPLGSLSAPGSARRQAQQQGCGSLVGKNV